jgi:hypothetical protein
MIEMINPKRANNFHRFKEKREKTQAIGIARSKKMNWRRTIAYDVPFSSSE